MTSPDDLLAQLDAYEQRVEVTCPHSGCWDFTRLTGALKAVLAKCAEIRASLPDDFEGWQWWEAMDACEKEFRRVVAEQMEGQ